MRERNESKTMTLTIGYGGLIFLLVMMIFSSVANAQTGTISGSVQDANTSEPLYGVHVTVQQTGAKTETDIDGRFTIRGIQLGSYNLEIRRSGYVAKEVPVSVESGVHIVEDLELTPDFAEGDRVFSVARQRGINRALTRQKQATHIGSVISSEHIGGFVDYSIEDAVLRLPGVQRNERGELNIRGTGYNRYYVTVDGQRLGSSGLGDRSFDLGSISPNLVRDVELIKVLTPDMYADGLSGVVNLVTHQPADGQLRINARAGLGGTPRYFKYHGLANDFSLDAFYPATEEISVALGVSYQDDHRPSDMLGIDYEVADFGNGPVDAIERVSPGLNLHQESRLASRFQITFQPSDRSSLYAKALLNINNRDNQKHTNFWSAGGDWINQDSTGLQGGQGVYGYQAAFREVKNTQYTVQAGARHIFDRMNMEYSIGWTQTDIENHYYEFPFAVSGLDYQTDWSDRLRPTMVPTGIRLQEDESIDRRLVRLQTMRNTINLHVDNQYSANLSFEVPFGLGSIQFGGNALLSHKDGGLSDTDLDNLRPLTQYRFFVVPGGNFEPLNEYNVPWVVDMDRAIRFINTNEPGMRTDEDAHFWRSDIWNHDIYENLYAGYSMATFEIWNFIILGGVRVEHSVNTYEGQITRFNRFGSHEETIDTSQTSSNTHLFPNAQVKYDIGGRSSIRAAWSRSIWRPDYNMLAPFERISEQDSTLFRGNSDLDPIVSDNLDLLFEHYISHTGQLGFGVFYKELSDFIILEQGSESGGSYDGWQKSTFVNGGESVTLYGAEVSWQQRLEFLPGFLRNMGVYANYTYTASDYNGVYRTGVSYPGHSPHVANAAVNYSQGRFSGQVSYHWRGELLEELQDSRELAPSIDGDQQVYMDRYRDAFGKLAASMGFRISESFRFWAEATNLTGGQERIDYYHTREHYPANLWRSGYSFRAGLRYTL